MDICLHDPIGLHPPHHTPSRVGAELFHGDRRTDMTKLIVAFRNIAKAHKNWGITFLQSLSLFAD